jgi:hypothetical protein
MRHWPLGTGFCSREATALQGCREAGTGYDALALLQMDPHGGAGGTGGGAGGSWSWFVLPDFLVLSR